MKCPSCKTDSLEPAFIEKQFRAHSCSTCSGDWILIEDFVYWSERSEVAPPEQDAAGYLPEDSKNALICPVTGTIMQKYRISNASDHKLDYSPQVGGVWLDAGEWQFLKGQGLASQIGRIFTDSWQSQLRAKDTQATFVSLYERKFGTDDYRKAQEVRAWLASSDKKAELRAYLLAEDPYGGSGR
ncbi:MAG: zf-TFIIB domain-containing protein [Halioglobus sp.]